MARYYGSLCWPQNGITKYRVFFCQYVMLLYSFPNLGMLLLMPNLEDVVLLSFVSISKKKKKKNQHLTLNE